MIDYEEFINMMKDQMGMDIIPSEPFEKLVNHSQDQE